MKSPKKPIFQRKKRQILVSALSVLLVGTICQNPLAAVSEKVSISISELENRSLLTASLPNSQTEKPQRKRVATPSNAESSEESVNPSDLDTELPSSQDKAVSKEVRVTLNEPFFTGTYNNGNPPSGSPKSYNLYYGRDNFTAIDANNTPYQGHLTQITIEREPGNAPGEYKILSAKSREFEKITFDGPYSTYVINKKPYPYSTTRTSNALADGKEHLLNLSEIFNFKEANKNIPEKVTIGQMSDADKARFDKFPIQGNTGDTLCYTLKKSNEPFEVAIPLQFENNYIEFPSMTLYLKVNSIEHVQTRTEADIIAFKKAHPFSAKSDTYAESPSISEERAGKLSSQSRQNALNALNFYRYIAGIPANVVYDEQLEYYAQAGTTLLTKVKKLTHFPDKPADVSQDFFDAAYEGTSSSNLGQGYSNLVDALNRGWMNDGDSSNIARAGHRMWCLNVPMGKVAFGKSGEYTAMYALDKSSTDPADPAYVMWPAQTMPIEYFKGPWTLSLRDQTYFKSFSESGIENIRISMTSRKNGKTYEITSKDKNVSGKYMNVDSNNLIFQPGSSFSSGDDVTVTISGLKNIHGESETISYTVHFFSMGGTSGSDSSSNGSGSGGSGGSGWGSSGGGGSYSTGSGSSSSKGRVPGSPQTNLPSYVVTGTWSQIGDGIWNFSDNTNVRYTNRWAAVYNPYANTSAGFQAFDWFRFDENGGMLTGWFTDPADGNIYYLNPHSDSTRGRMMTGWTVIDGKEYYFNPESDGTRGRMFRNEPTKDGHFLGADGVKIY